MPWNVGVARTAWYSIHGTGGQITLTTEGSSYDTALFVYAESPAGSLVTCGDDISGSDQQSSVSFASNAASTYAVQVGRACNETGPPKCTEDPPAGTLKLAATAVTADHDADGDGYIGRAFGGPDCDDANAAIHQGARDVPHDGIDQDCDGTDAPYPPLQVSAMISVGYARNGNYTTVSELPVSGAPAGAKVTLTCAPKRLGCRFTHRTVTVRSARKLQLGKYLRHTRLKRNARVGVLIAAPGYIGTLYDWSIRINHLPKRTIRCVEPGETQPRTSCS